MCMYRQPTTDPGNISCIMIDINPFSFNSYLLHPLISRNAITFDYADGAENKYDYNINHSVDDGDDCDAKKNMMLLVMMMMLMATVMLIVMMMIMLATTMT